VLVVAGGGGGGGDFGDPACDTYHDGGNGGAQGGNAGLDGNGAGGGAGSSSDSGLTGATVTADSCHGGNVQQGEVIISAASPGGRKALFLVAGQVSSRTAGPAAGLAGAGSAGCAADCDDRGAAPR
jgi:hypothetical protein